MDTAINISKNYKSIESHDVKDVLVLLSMKDLGSKSDKEKGTIALKSHKQFGHSLSDK